MAPGPGIRIGDAEREAVATSLREHYARGRLTLEEFQQRLDAVFAAKTDLDLARITRDLPHVNSYAAPSYAAPSYAAQWPSSSPASSPLPGPGYPVGAGRRYRARTGAAAYSWLGLALWVCLLFLLVSVVWPLSLLPRTVLIALGVLAFLRRMFRRGIWGRRR